MLHAEAERTVAKLERLPHSPERAERLYLEERRFFGKWDAILDQGNGPDWLRNPEIAILVADAMRFFDVIDQFDVASAELAGRYKAGGAGNADTRCNIFAGDVMRAMGVPLPTKGNLGQGQGDPNATYTDPMTAQSRLLNDYLNRRIPWVASATDKGTLSDWVEIIPDTPAALNRLIAHVNAGKPALVSDAGHIAVVRPDQPALQSRQDLIIAQAGASNFLSGALRGHFTGTPQFFIHD
jgi:hypothetical protein